MTYVDELAEQVRATLALPDTGPGSLARYYALLVVTLGADIDARAVHDAWAMWRAQEGPDHQWVRPFDELPQEIRERDEPFAAALRAVADAHAVRPHRPT